MSVYDFTVTDNKGNGVSLKEYEGKVLLIVNTATRCGLTPQYEGLEALYEKYRDRGFEILDFPCNQFAFQAPGDAEKIDSFCKLNYGTKFPRFAKIKVNGADADPLYVYLKEQKPGRIGVEFRQIPDRPRRKRGRTFRPDRQAEDTGRSDRSGACKVIYAAI